MDVDFSDILEKSRALRSKQEALTSGYADNIPRLERALPQIDRESRRLAPSAAPPAADDSAALRLLSAHGFRPNAIDRTLQSVALRHAFEPYNAVPDTDLHAHLAQAHETAVLAAVDDARAAAAAASRRAVAAAVDAEWDASKRDLVTLPPLHYRPHTPAPAKAASTAPGGVFASPFRFPRGRPALADADPGVERSGGGTRRPAPAAPIYESVVRRAVHARANPNIVMAVATELDDALVAHLAPRGDVAGAPRSVQHLHAVFTALRYVTGEAEGSVPPAEGAWGGLYVADDRRKAYLGAYLFLCLQFREDKMKREIEARPVEAKRGGVPGMKADVKAYLNLIFDRGVPDQLADGVMHDGLPIWPQIYYCMRAGSMAVAWEVARDALQNGCTDPSLALFGECLEAVATSAERRTLPHSLLEKLVQDYGLTAKQGEDPYQRVCYVTLARLDPAAGDKMALPDNDYSLLFYSIEDYLWLRLSVARLDGDDQAPDWLAMYQLSLSAIQEEVRSFGPAHFDPQGDTPSFYALVLILTGQYAEAITYMDRGARAIAEATHVAYTLYYYGMLREPGRQVAVMGEDVESAHFEFDYAELLWRYVSRFSKIDATAAAVYLYTLRDDDERKELLRKLLLQTKKFDLLLGNQSSETGSGDRRQVGVLEELWPLGGRDAAVGGGWLSVVEAAAADAEEAGDRTSAVALYDVAGVRGKVVAILIDKLSAELTSRGSSARSRVFKEANEYRVKIEKDRLNYGVEQLQQDVLLEQLLPSFYMLLSLGEFFDLLWSKQFEKAWDLMSKMSFLPSSNAELVSKTAELRIGGGVWADALCDRVPEILLGAMEVLAALHSGHRASMRGGGAGGSGAARSSAVLRAAARTYINFSGMLRNLSADISARLVKLEVLMT